MTQLAIPFRTSRAVRQRRESKRESIVRFFLAHLGEKVSSMRLHEMFGTAVRTRISEIRRLEDFPIDIEAKYQATPEGAEHSWYVATLRKAVQ